MIVTGIGQQACKLLINTEMMLIMVDTRSFPLNALLPSHRTAKQIPMRRRVRSRELIFIPSLLQIHILSLILN